MQKTKTPKRNPIISPRFVPGKYTLKFLLSGVFIIVLILFSKSCYLIKQSAGQLKIRFTQIPLEKAIEQEQNPAYKALLEEVPQIVNFGTESLFLKKSENYTDYFKNEKKGVSFVVTAAPRLKLETYHWWYPVVGKLPFRGYFDEKDAQAFAKETEADGLDVYVFAASAYSTLGWFKDPITTNMLRNGLFSLADTILHEMVHASFFIKNEGDFNESLASFVGSTGAEQYLLKNKPNGQEIINARAANKIKYKEFTEYIDQIKKKLKLLYSSNLPDDKKLIRREEIFKEAGEGIRGIYPKSSDKFRKINNARLMQISRYRESNPMFQALLDKNSSDWEAFWNDIRSNSAQLVAQFNSTQ